jgi:hypothetical protein
MRLGLGLGFLNRIIAIVTSFLLQENGDALLLENGDNLVLDE